MNTPPQQSQFLFKIVSTTKGWRMFFNYSSLTFIYMYADSYYWCGHLKKGCETLCKQVTRDRWPYWKGIFFFFNEYAAQYYVALQLQSSCDESGFSSQNLRRLDGDTL